MKRIVFWFVLLGISVQAQTDFKPHVSNFNMTSFTYKHNKKWSAYIEAQARSIEDFMLPNYYEVKGGPTYHINKNNAVLIGVGKYGTYRDSDLYQNEIRIWLQYIYSHSIDKVKFDHRLRAEKRFYKYPQTDTKSNTERYRYRLSATMPLNGQKIEPGVVFVNAFEEIFVGPKDPDTFKRNRTYGGFGYQVNDWMNANLGYMWQKEFSSVNGNKNYHFVYFGLNFTFDRLKDYSNPGTIHVAD